MLVRKENRIYRYTESLDNKDKRFLLSEAKKIIETCEDLWSRKLKFSEQQNLDAVIVIDCYDSSKDYAFSMGHNLRDDSISDTLHRLQKNLDNFKGDDYTYTISIGADRRGKIHLSSSSDPLWLFEEDLLVIQDGKVLESIELPTA